MIDFIDWDDVPEIMSKEQFYQICHISKTTAGMLLKSGKVPSEYCSKPRCYKIRKQDLWNIWKTELYFRTLIQLRKAGTAELMKTAFRRICRKTI